MNTTVRLATDKDFESIFPLFGQLWPNKSLNRNELKNVYNRGIKSDSDELLCLELENKVIGQGDNSRKNNREVLVLFLMPESRSLKDRE